MSKDVIERIITASVQSNPVFLRFAQLSDEDKQRVMDLVKQKVENKGTGEEESTEQETEESTEQETEEPAKTEESEEQEVGEKPMEDATSQDEEEAEGTDTSDSDAEVDSQSPAADEPEEQESVEAPSGDDEEGSPALTDIVNGIAEEIETIKKDNKVTPTEVMGLMDNMVRMVTELLRAKPGRVRRSSMLTRREAIIAERLIREDKIIREINAGHSYALERLTLDVEGWQPLNIDVLRAIDRTWFDAKDDEGEDIEGRMNSVRYERVDPRGPLTYQQEKEMKRQRKSPIQRLTGTIPQGSMREAVKAIGKMLRQKFDLKIVDYGIKRL